MRIAIFGASSQVGSSVAFYIKHFTSHEPVCFIRSHYSSIFFEIANLKTIAVDITNTHLLKNSLKDIDIVLDFTYPSGDSFEISGKIKQNLENIIGALPQRTVYIYMSSIMAYGMSAAEKWVKSYTFPKATYGFIKRKAEKLASEVGARYNIPVYNFRLGQVHGFLQSVSEAFRYNLSSVQTGYLDGKETDLTNTIFISALCEAIIQCGIKKPDEGIYTVISDPQWTLQELYQFYLDFFDLDARIIYKPSQKVFSIKKLLLNTTRSFRPFLETYLLKKLPNTYTTVKGRYRTMEISRKITSEEFTYLDFNLLGVPPLRVIKNLNCSVKAIWGTEKEMQTVYLSLIAQYTK